MSLYVKYLVCYDISNTRTRSKFFDFLKDLGLTPIQKSVFFGDLKTPEVRSLKAAAEKWVHLGSPWNAALTFKKKY